VPVSGISSKIAPFLSEYIPKELALQGISKVAPKVAEILKKGVGQGLDLGEGLNYIKDLVNKKQEPSIVSEESIRKIAPELHNFIKDYKSRGRSAEEVIAISGLPNSKVNYKKQLMLLEKNFKIPSLDIIKKAYYGQESPQESDQNSESPLLDVLKKLRELRSARGPQI
jgi:hypothetical protein